MFRLTRTSAVVFVALLVVGGSAGITSKELPLSKPEEAGLSSERLARMNKAIHEYVVCGFCGGCDWRSRGTRDVNVIRFVFFLDRLDGVVHRGVDDRDAVRDARNWGADGAREIPVLVDAELCQE